MLESEFIYPNGSESVGISQPYVHLSSKLLNPIIFEGLVLRDMDLNTAISEVLLGARSDSVGAFCLEGHVGLDRDINLGLLEASLSSSNLESIAGLASADLMPAIASRSMDGGMS